MSRRWFGIAAISAAGLVATGLIPFLGVAGAAACPSWSDPPNDSSAFQLGTPGTEEATLDIVQTTVRSSGSDVLLSVKTASLTATPSKYGEEHAVQLNVEGQNLLFYADRGPTGVFAGILNLTTDTPNGAATATYDVPAATVTIKATQAEIDKAAGKSVKGKPTTAMATSTALQLDGLPVPNYDDSSAPATVGYVVGEACTGGGGPQPTGSPTGSPTGTPTPSPTGTPTPSPTSTPGGLPEGYPKTGCTTFDDAPSDGTPTVATGAALPNQSGLDIRSVAINATPRRIFAYVKLTSLAATPPTPYLGDRFELAFKVGAKEYRYSVGRSGPGTTAPNFGKVDGIENPALSVEEKFDTTNAYAILSIDRVALEDVHGTPMPAGTVLTNVRAETVAMQPGRDFYADLAQHSDAAKRTYTMGESPCFDPPPSTLEYVGDRTVQFGDVASLDAELLDEVGAGLPDRTVTFKVGSTTVSARTDEDGYAQADLPAGLRAGSYTVVASFAGDGVAKGSSTPPVSFTVALEKTSLKLTVVKSGTKRTVTAKLTDDDRKPVAGQVVTWYINGKKYSSPKTNSSGVVTLTAAKPTQTVKAVFATVSGKYSGSTAQVKV